MERLKNMPKNKFAISIIGTIFKPSLYSGGTIQFKSINIKRHSQKNKHAKYQESISLPWHKALDRLLPLMSFVKKRKVQKHT
jgi:hypothetical protein